MYRDSEFSTIAQLYLFDFLFLATGVAGSPCVSCVVSVESVHL